MKEFPLFLKCELQRLLVRYVSKCIIIFICIMYAFAFNPTFSLIYVSMQQSSQGSIIFYSRANNLIG